MDDKARERYWWDHLVSTKQKSQQAYDDGILKVCGGSLGVSFAFVSNFIEGSPACVWLLLLAWACWALALVGVIASHRYSTLAADAALATMRRPRIVGLDRGDPGPDDSWQNRIVKKLNPWGWILFAAGVVFLGMFVYLNTGEASMAKSDTKSGTKPGNVTDTPRAPRPGGGTTAEERGHDIVAPPGRGQGQDSTAQSRRGGDRSGGKKK